MSKTNYQIPMPKERIDELKQKPFTLIFPNAIADIEQGVCPMCKQKVTGFRDDLSYKEYLINGMCQKCQDKASEW